MRSRGLRVDFYPALAPTDALRWTIARARQTHDVLHVVTGYDTDPVGEVALQGFTLGQVRMAPISVLIISAGLLAILRHTPQRIEDALELLTQGWIRGSAARCFLGFRFEEHWETPLEEVRGLLRLPAPPRPSRTLLGLRGRELQDQALAAIE
jgi:ubiquinone biosynthesis protein COQ4